MGSGRGITESEEAAGVGSSRRGWEAGKGLQLVAWQAVKVDNGAEEVGGLQQIVLNGGAYPTSTI